MEVPRDVGCKKGYGGTCVVCGGTRVVWRDMCSVWRDMCIVEGHVQCVLTLNRSIPLNGNISCIAY